MKDSEDKVYNFDDYKVHRFTTHILTMDDFPTWDIDCWANNSLIVPIENIPYEYEKVDWAKIVQEEPLKSSDKTLYIYPTCKIPRALVEQKYKKVLNPWLADRVVIPKLGITNVSLYIALFVNEEAQTIVYINCGYDTGARDKINSLQKGVSLQDVLTQKQLGRLYEYENNYNLPYKMIDILNAKLEYFGTAIIVPKNEEYKAEILTGILPKNKIVYEDSVIASVQNTSTAPTYDNLISLADMLDSSDSDTVGSAIKALAAMDYIHYPNSIKYLLQNTSMWKYNNATNSTAAKFMFKKLLGGTARRPVRYGDSFITEEDYNLFEKLVRHFNKNVEDVSTYLKWYPFTYEDENFGVHPRIKKD